MAKIRSIDDLRKIRDDSQSAMDLREDGDFSTKITVHMGTCGIAAGARTVMSALLEEIEKRDLKGISVSQSGCLGLCDAEPMATFVTAKDGAIRYGHLDADKMREIVDKHLLAGKPVTEFILHDNRGER